MQRLDEDEDDEEKEQQQVDVEREQQLQCSIDAPAVPNHKQYNNPQQSVQYFEFANEAAATLEPELELELEPEPEILPVQPIDIQFDLVQYKANVRYLRHTPSNSNSNSNCSLNLNLEQLQAAHAEQTQSVTLPMPVHVQRCRSAGSRACSVSVGSQFDGNYHNVIIMEQPPNDDYPIVKWDINGNSLEEHEDEEHFDLRRHWDAFDHRWRQLQSQSLSQSQQAQLSRRLGSGHSQRSSHHSSSCTLETWIDDAETNLWDDSQNLLQVHSNHNHNYNNNNCNQCLKSF